jgi:hypothetical protein
MSLLGLLLLALLQPSATVSSTIIAQPNAFGTPLHMIAEYLSASQSISWTSSTVECTGTNFTVARVDINIWNAAAIALGPSLAQSTNVAHKNAAVPHFPGLPKDKFNHISRCYLHGVGVRMEEISRNVPHIQAYIREQGSTDSIWWGFDHPSKPDITLWYYTAIYQWIDEVPKGLIEDMYSQLLYAACGPPWDVLGGVESLVDSKTYHHVAQVEFYASTR